MNTLRVYWRDKFDGKAVTIDAAAFDPSLHRHEADGKWPSAEPKAVKPVEPVKIAPPVIEKPAEPIAMPRTPKTTKKSK